ncbi:hypothetical protein NB530_15310 [Vibrio alginolyticus]|nr:hypothetical protein [Vibrio alginolyticus]
MTVESKKKNIDPNEPFLFVKAKKGVGKSALLKHTKIKISKGNNSVITAYVKGSQLSAPLPSELDHAALAINDWKRRICGVINREIGRSIGLAISDDQMLLVENSELDNYRDRNIVGALSERLKGKILGLERKSVGINNEDKLLERYSQKNNMDFWLFVDDIDATFKNNSNYILYLATFFSACRELSYAVEGLKIRASIRADVWPILRTHDESMDHCEQYMRELRWNDDDIANIIGQKIYSFCKAEDEFDFPKEEFFYDTPFKKSQLLLASKYPWYKKRVYSVVPLSIFSYGRPRWSSKLLRDAAKNSASNGNENIKWNDLKSAFPTYSRQRYLELLAEHRHQFPQLEKLFECFSHGPSRYKTKALLSKTSEYISRYGAPKIDGSESESDNLNVAHFLFRSGFIVGSSEQEDNYYVEFEDRPTLLVTDANLDDGLDWVIPMCYRKALSIDKKS